MIFDAPLVPGGFEERIKVARKFIALDNPYLKLIEQTVCDSEEHLAKLMDKICGAKGEGVMLKDPKSLYERKRSFSLLKVKRFEDAEAKVIGHTNGTGRLWGQCGAIIV